MRLVELSRGISSLFTKKIHRLTRNSYLHLFKNKRSLCAALLISLQLLSPASAIVYAGAVSSNDVGSSASLDPVSNKATRLQTQGSSGVDQSTGAFTYSYPITLPEGRNGMTPKLALSYNSQNTESGWFGYNWLLSIPYIERTVKTGSDKLYTNPSFVSSLHGEIISNNGSTYEQKVDDGSYAKYTFTGASWQMTDRDGTTYYFGNSYTSRVQDDAGTKIGRWYLTEVRDKFGNGMTYQYSKDGGTVYPQSISYTEHALAREVNVVTFTLESKQDALSNYRYGFRTVDSKRISAIKLNSNGKDIAFISFSYLKGSNNSRSLLQSVEEKRLSTNDDWTVLPKTTFEYENSPITFSGTISTTANPYGTNNVVMDINNDGIQDIYNAGDGFYPVDINGDFKKDLAQSDINYGAASNNQYIVFKYSQGGSFLTRNLAYPKDGYVRTQPTGMPIPTIRYMGEGQWWWTQESVIADINGDGFDDVIYNNPYVGQGVGINTTNNTFDYSKPSSLAFNISNDQIVDINGDGLQDKISRTTSSTSTLFRVYLNNGSQYASTSEFVYDAKIASTPYDVGVRFSDVNNDGLPDVLRSYTSSYTTQGYTAGCAAGYTAPPSTAPINQTINEILINTGTSFVPASSTVPGYFVTYSACTAGSSYYNLYTANTREHDTNGDLTTDYDGATNNTQKQDILKKVVSPLGATLDVSYTWTTKTGLNPKLPVPTYIVATTTEKLSPSDTNPRAIGYSFHDGQMYFNETSPRDRKFAGFAKVEVVDGTTKTVTYYHQGNGDDYLTGEKGDSYHNIGRPYRTDIFDSSSGSSTLLSKSLSLYTTYSFASSSFTYLDAQVVNSYNSNGSYLSSASKYAYDETKRLIKTSYDYGDIDAFTSFASSTISDKGTDILTTSYQYSTGRPERLIKQTVTDYSGNILDSTSNYYDGLPFGLADKGALTSSINTLYTSTGSVATTTTSQITYDATGNVIQTSNPLNQVTKFVYDSSYLYPIQKIDPLNGTTTYTYDPYTQNLLTVTTPDGITSVKETDGFGNTVRSYTKSSSGGIYDDVKTVYAYGSGLSVYGVRMNVSGNPSRTFEKYDAYGRRIQSKVETTQDVFLTEDITYDAKGNIVSSSLPYTAQGYGYTTDTPTNGKIVYGYDALGRVTTKQSFGTTLTYQYGARSLTVFDNAETQHKKLYTYDVRNNLTSVTEYNNGQTYVTSYSYTPLSKLSRITDANGNIRNFSYRSDGKLVYQEDPHASTDTTYTTYIYTHDALGNLLTKSGPLGSISYSYDKLNRPTSRVVSDTANGTSTLSISYSGCANSYMSPCVVNRGTSSTTYAYDQSGRLLSDSLSIDGRVFTRSYTYDSLGNPLTITYPDNGKVTYTYTLDGKQSSLSYTTPSGAIKPIVTGETYTSLGQVSSRIYGNGVRMCNTYTTQSLGGVIAPRLGTSVYMFNTDGCAQAPNQIELYKDQFTYKDSLTPSSILTTYKDIKGITNTKSDTFTYDNLARLTGVSTSYNGTTAIVESLTYDPIGNLLKHNDILYRYSKDGQQNVHAATSVGGTHIDYDAQGNRIRVGDNVYTWNMLNQMLSASSTNGTEFYTYDENGERVKKVIKANTAINQKATPAQATSTLSTFRVGDLLAAVATTSMYVATSSHAKLTTLNLLSTTTLTTLVGDIYGSPFVSKFCATQLSSSARQSCVATTTKQLLANNLNNRSTSTIASIGFVDDVIGIVTGKFLLPASYTGIATSSIATSSNVVFAVDTATINAYTTYVGTGIVVPLTEYANLPLISTSTYTTLGQIGFADTSRIKALFTLAGCTTVASPCANAQKVVFEKMYKEKGYILSDRALHEMWHVYAQKARIPTSGTDLTATSTFLTLSSIPTVSGITTSNATSTYSSGAYFTTQYSAQNTAEPRLQFIGTIPYYVSQSVFTELQQAGITQSTLENYQALIQDVFNIKVASSSDYMLALSLFAFYDKKTTLSVQALKELYLSAIGASIIPNKVEDYTSVSVFDVSGNLIIKSYGKSGSNSYDILLSNTCRSAGSGNPHARCVIGSSQFTLPVASSSVIKYILTLLPPPSQAELPLVVGESPNPAYPISNGANYYSSERPIIFPNWYYASNVVDPGYFKQEVDITSTILKIQASSTAPEKFLAITEREWMTGSLWPYEAQSVTLKAYASTPRLTLASTTLTSLLDPYFLVISSSTASVATTSLLAYYKLDESSGNAVDATGNGYVLANSGSTGYASGKINNGAVFNNTNAKSLQNSGAINFVTGGTRTWTTWVNFSNINGYVLDNVTTNGNIRMIVYGGGDNKIHMFANGNEVVSGNLTTGTWYHVAVTQNGSTWQLYINGTFIGSTSTGGLSYAANGFVIGNSYAGGGPGQNTTDEVSIWGRVLTPSEITSLYNAGNGLSYPFQGSAGQYQLATTTFTPQIQSSFASYFAEIYDSSSLYVSTSTIATTTAISLESSLEFASTTLRDAYDISKVFLATTTPWCTSNASTTECDKQARKSFFKEVIKNLSGFSPSDAAIEEFWMVHKGILVLADSTYASSTVMVTTPGYWKSLEQGVSLPTGGTITNSGQYRIHTFTSSGNFNVPFPINVELLVVGGGGNGGGGNSSYAGGGGGAGQVATSSSYLTQSLSTSVTIGQAAQSSSFGPLIAVGGSNGNFASSGGSSGNGFSGGATGQSNYQMSGGGAGSTGNGNPNVLGVAGNGGPGFTSSISGTSTCYAGGGGGANSGSGMCGGGNGGAMYAVGQSAVPNTGSGGGGSSYYAGGSSSGASGVVIARYMTTTNGSTTQIYIATSTDPVAVVSSSSTSMYRFSRSQIAGLSTTTEMFWSTSTVPGYWQVVPESFPIGGATTSSSTYTIHTFTSSSTFISSKNIPSLEILLVGGGGGAFGDGWPSSGGGAGEVISTTVSVTANQSYSIVIGQGGVVAQEGGTTTAFSLNAKGGGYGRGYGYTGGSSGNGYSGGAWTSAGGGGAGSSGNGLPGPGSSYGGNGGPGTFSSITGTSLCYAGGGGGAGWDGYGSGINPCRSGANTGSGVSLPVHAKTGTGDSGIVIARYPTSLFMGTTTAYVATSTLYTPLKRLNLVPSGLLSDLQHNTLYSTSTFALATTTKIVSEETYNELLNTPVRINSDVDVIFDYALPFATSTCPGQVATSSCVINAQKAKVKTTLANLSGFNLSDAALEELYQVKTNGLSVVPLSPADASYTSSSQSLIIPLATSSALVTFATSTVGTSTLTSIQQGMCTLGTAGATSSQCYVNLPFVTSSIDSLSLSLDMATSSIATSNIAYTLTFTTQDTSTSTSGTSTPVFITTASTSSIVGQKGAGATFTYDVSQAFKSYLSASTSRFTLTPSVSATSTTITNPKILVTRTISTPRISYASTTIASQFVPISRSSLIGFATSTGTTTVDMTSVPEFLLSSVYLSSVDAILSGIPLSSGTQKVATTSLRAYYKFDESSGNATDSSGNGNVLTNVGTVGYVSSKINNGIDLGAGNTSKYFIATNNLGLTGTQDKTFSVWVNLQSAPSSGAYYDLFGHRTNLGVDRYMGVYYRNNGGTYQIRSLYSTLGTDTNYTLTPGTWYHFSLVLSSGIVYLYVNNALVHSYAQGSYTANQNYTHVGRTPDAAIQYASALYDEFGVWGRALTSTEINNLYNGGLALPYPFQAQTGSSTTNYGGSYVDTVYPALPSNQRILPVLSLYPSIGTSTVSTSTIFLNSVSSSTQSTIYKPFNGSYSDDVTKNIVTTYFTLNGVLVGSYSYQKGQEVSTGKVNFAHTNHVGTPVLETDAQGDIVQMDITDTFGNYVHRDQRVDNALHTKSYTGHEYDDISALLYMKARYGDMKMHSFLSVDPMLYKLPESYLTDPQQMNSYAYARNNPIIYTDPTGGYIESALDIGFVAYDLNSLKGNLRDGNYYDAAIDGLALVGDSIGLATPGATGFGMGIRFVAHGGDAGKAFGGVKEVYQTANQAVNKNQKLGGEIQQVLLPKIQNEKVQNIVKQLFRKQDTKPGGTVGEMKRELSSSDFNVSASHYTKVKERIVNINNTLKTQSLTKYETNLLNTLKKSLVKVKNQVDAHLKNNN